jgi:hypothetical protein
MSRKTRIAAEDVYEIVREPSRSKIGVVSLIADEDARHDYRSRLRLKTLLSTGRRGVCAIQIPFLPAASSRRGG